MPYSTTSDLEGWKKPFGQFVLKNEAGILEIRNRTLEMFGQMLSRKKKIKYNSWLPLTFHLFFGQMVRTATKRSCR